MESKLDILDDLECNSFQYYLQELSNKISNGTEYICLLAVNGMNLLYQEELFVIELEYSNSLDQMVPSFIRYQTDTNHSLVVIIDEFKDKKDLDK